MEGISCQSRTGFFFIQLHHSGFRPVFFVNEVLKDKFEFLGIHGVVMVRMTDVYMRMLKYVCSKVRGSVYIQVVCSLGRRKDGEWEKIDGSFKRVSVLVLDAIRL